MKKAVSLLLVIVMICSTFAGLQITSHALASSGSCGENVTYSFNASTGELVISGSGAMSDYDYDNCPFKENRNIKSIIIQSGVTSIGENAFRGCSCLNSISMSDTITVIGNYSFYLCSALKKIVFPNSLKKIGICAFYGASSLNSIVFGESLKTIDNAAFQYCEQLSSISLPNSVTSIGKGTFLYCSALSNIFLPDSVSQIGDSAFTDTAFWKNNGNWKSGILYINHCLIRVKVDKSGSVKVDDNTTCITQSAFSYCENITSISLPETITQIDDLTFKGCKSLTNIIIPDSVKTIGDWAFESSGLTSITLSNSLTTIGTKAFYDCSTLTSITIPDSVTIIGENAFCFCSMLKTLTLPVSTKINNSGSFYGCYNIERVTLTKGTGKMRNYSVTEYTDSGKVTCYKYTPWYISRSLKYLVVNEGVNNIGRYAFYSCSLLESIVLPNTVNKINEAAFEKCENLKSIKICNKDCDIYDSSLTIHEGAKITGYANSTAQTYATKYNRKFIVETDTTKPTGSIFSTNNIASSQTATLTLSDDTGVAGYYWGTNSTYTSNTYLTVSSGSIEKAISAAGRYYLTVKDTAGNISDTVSITFYKTTLNANSGSVSPTSVLTQSGKSFTLPTPTRDNYSFEGWYTSADGGNKVSNSYTVNSNATLYAHWKSLTHTHTWNNGSVTKATTCTESGIKTYTCSSCGATTTEEISALNHKFNNHRIAATLKKNGSIQSVCVNCGKVKSTIVIYYPKAFKLSTKTYTYNGKAKTPKVSVYDSNGKQISSSNYTVKYLNNKNVGVATAYVVFKGNYSGTKKLQFTIVPASTAIQKANSPLKTGIYVQWKKVGNITGYEVQVSASSSFASGKRNRLTKNYIKIKKLKSKKIYFVRVRTYKVVNGKPYYSLWSKTAKVKIK